MNTNNARKLKTATTYNAAADHFDDVPNAYWGRYGRKTVERLNLNHGDRVLDIGCGTGASALPAAEMVGAQGHVTGIDLADNLLQIARQKAIALNLTNLTFQIGDMENLGFADESFDAIVSIFSIFFASNIERQVAELWRMVRPNGKLAITTWGPDMFGPIYSVWREAGSAERKDLFTTVNPWDRITTVENVHRMMEESGLSNIQVVAEDGQQPLRSPEDAWLIVMGSGLRGAVNELEPPAAKRVQQAVIEYAHQNNVTSVATNVIYAVGTKQ